MRYAETGLSLGEELGRQSLERTLGEEQPKCMQLS